ncbi:MAG: hypothetical protein AABZ74_16660 [Cyanobacteriota bacterium]
MVGMKTTNYIVKISFIFVLLITFSGNKKLEDENLDVKTIIKKIIETDQKNTLLTAVVSTYSKGYYHLGKKTDKLIEKKMSGRITTKKPKMILFKVLETDDKMAKDSTLLYTGGKDVKIKPGGIFRFMTITYKIDDPIFLNSRNHKFTFDGLTGVKDPLSKVELIGTSEVNNRKIYMLKVVSPTKADPEITHEIYKVDAKSFVVLSIRMFVNTDLVSEYSIKDINTNIQDSPELFKL